MDELTQDIQYYRAYLGENEDPKKTLIINNIVTLGELELPHDLLYYRGYLGRA